MRLSLSELKPALADTTARPALMAWMRTEAVWPAPLAFLVIRLMMPPVPSARNSADGLVITSMRSMRSAGVDCRAWARLSLLNWDEGLPSTRTVTLGSPLRDRLPWTSTWTDGMLRRTSPETAMPVVAERSLRYRIALPVDGGLDLIVGSGDRRRLLTVAPSAGAWRGLAGLVLGDGFAGRGGGVSWTGGSAAASASAASRTTVMISPSISYATRVALHE